MNNRRNIMLACSALIIGALSLNAQEPAGPPPPPPGDFMPGGPIGPRMEILGFGEMRPGKVVSGAPYNAVAITETKQTLADGNVIDRKVQSNVYRDSQGRTRRETTFTGVGPLAASGQPRSMISIHDPVASTAFILHADTKVAEQLPVPPKRAKNPENFQNKFEARVQQEIANGTLKERRLGHADDKWCGRAGYSVHPNYSGWPDWQCQSHHRRERTMVFPRPAACREKCAK